MTTRKTTKPAARRTKTVVPQPIKKTEDAALATRKAIGTVKDYAKAGGILGFCFLRTLATGRVTK